MNIGFCIGNGSSKDNFNLNELKDVGPTYGCNKLIETFNLDNTIVVDRNVLIELISQGYNKKTNIYTRQTYSKLIEAENLHFLDNPIQNPIQRWDRESQWGSGTHAINLAAIHGLEIIIMIGYDLYDDDINSTCWIYQIQKCFELHPDTQFVQIQNKKWTSPRNWIAPNFLRDDVNGLKNLLKDLR